MTCLHCHHEHSEPDHCGEDIWIWEGYDYSRDRAVKGHRQRAMCGCTKTPDEQTPPPRDPGA